MRKLESEFTEEKLYICVNELKKLSLYSKVKEAFICINHGDTLKFCGNGDSQVMVKATWSQADLVLSKNRTYTISYSTDGHQVYPIERKNMLFERLSPCGKFLAIARETSFLFISLCFCIYVNLF
jgi:hypothetical protein